MKPLNQSYRLFVLFNICPANDSASAWIKFGNRVLTMLALSFMTSANYFGLDFMIAYAKIDLEKAFTVILQSGALFEASYIVH